MVDVEHRLPARVSGVSSCIHRREYRWSYGTSLLIIQPVSISDT